MVPNSLENHLTLTITLHVQSSAWRNHEINGSLLGLQKNVLKACHLVFFLRLVKCKYVGVIAETFNSHGPQLSPLQQYGCSTSTSPSHLQPCIIIHHFPDCITTILHDIHECNIASFKAMELKRMSPVPASATSKQRMPEQSMPSMRHDPDRQTQRQCWRPAETSKNQAQGCHSCLLARNLWARKGAPLVFV